VRLPCAWVIVGLLALALGCAQPAAPAGLPVPVTVRVQPFEGLSVARLDKLVPDFRRLLPRVEVLPPIPLPSMAHYAPRNRYRADSLLRYLHTRTPAGAVTIGLTHRDISTSHHGHADWGIMGLGMLPGNACVASTFRLDKTQIDTQFFKVAIHELGHTQGLPHCPEPSCRMRDQGGRNQLDAQTDFCPRCKAFLLAKGWQLAHG
jgi:archaemetzincin